MRSKSFSLKPVIHFLAYIWEENARDFALGIIQGMFSLT